MRKRRKAWETQGKSEYGAVVIEASISLPVFMFLIVTILSLVNICIAQTKIGLALNATAKEISQYSYLYSLSGLDKVQEGNYEAAGEIKASLDNTLAGITGLCNSLGGIKKEGNAIVSGDTGIESGFENIKGELKNGQASADKIYHELEQMAGDPKKYILGVARLGLNEVTEVAKSRAIAGPLTKVFIQKHLKSYENQICDEYLKHLGIKEGLDGIDFSNSVIFLNGSDNIILVAEYKIHVIELLNHDIALQFTQSAATKAWSAAPIGSNLPRPEEPATPGETEESTEEVTEEPEEETSEEETQTEEAEKQERPSWQQSQKDIAAEYPDYRTQVSFIKNEDGTIRETKYGEKGSIRVDLYKDGHCIEGMDWYVTTPTQRKALVREIKKEYEQRLELLPPGTKQTVILDIRGQNVSQEELDELYNDIMAATGNGIELKFKRT